MKIKSLISILFVLTTSAAPILAFADVFKCTLPSGQIVFQGTPCVTGEQNTIDDTNLQKNIKEAKEEELAQKERQEAQVAEARKYQEAYNALTPEEKIEVDAIPLETSPVSTEMEKSLSYTAEMKQVLKEYKLAAFPTDLKMQKIKEIQKAKDEKLLKERKLSNLRACKQAGCAFSSYYVGLQGLTLSEASSALGSMREQHIGDMHLAYISAPLENGQIAQIQMVIEGDKIHEVNQY